jgi:hypothetical protein
VKEMKKVKVGLVLLVIAGLLFSDPVFAQKDKPISPMSVNSWTIQFGFGPGIHYYNAYAAGFGPAFAASFEKGMWKLGPGVLTLGAETGLSYFSYSGYYGEPYGDYKYNWMSFVMAARSAYHYGWQVPGLDTYGGIAMGMRFLAFSSTYSDLYNGYYGYYNPAPVNFFGGIFVGTSYFFNNVIGINGELGFNIDYAQIGLIFKLK